MKDYSLAEETLGYVTSQEPSNTDKRLLIGGSKNTLISFQKSVYKRPGYTRLGPEDATETPNRNGWTWYTSTNTEIPQKFYDDELEMYLQTVDGIEIDEWIRIRNGWSTTNMLRADVIYDATEKLDLQIMVNGDANLYEWNGAVAVVKSVPSGTEVEKEGTNTFAQNRFYTTRNKTFFCVRTGAEYTYTGGETTTTLTGIADTTGLQAGDILVQKVVTASNKPGANRTNDYIFAFENQIVIGSDNDQLNYISQNDDYDDFTYSTPRVAGEGGLLTLDAPTRGYGSLGKRLIVFAGRDFVYKAEYEQITVGTTLAETIKVKRVDTAQDQGALNQESIVQIGNAIAYLSNEVALRIISNPDDLSGIKPKTLSNPIKPDFDAEDWEGAFGYWYKNMLIYTTPATSRMYIISFVEDADGKLFRFWNPPQTLPIGAMLQIDTGNGSEIYGLSNATPEAYKLFDGQSDGQYEDMDVENKRPIHAVAAFAYNNYKQRARLKTFDEYYVEGEITANTTDLDLNINYDFDGATQQITKTVDGSDADILEGSVSNNSLAQQSLALNPLGGLLNPPSDARKFRVVFEMAREDFHEISATFSTNDVDRYWKIIAHGANTELSRRRAINIRK